MAALDSIYDNLLNEAWSKTIAGNGKNTLLVHTQAEFKPEDTYYVFVCQLSKVSERYAWVTGDRAIDFSVGGNEENWKNLRIIEDRLIKGSDVISYIKNKENKILSGLTQYILDIKYIDPAIKDAVFASLITNTKSGPGRFEVGFYFVNANIAGQPDLKTYYNIVKALRDSSKNSNLKPIQIAAQTLPYIEDLINVRNIHHKNAEITGIDTSGLLESVNWDDPYPYGKIDSIVTSTIKSYNPDFTDADVNDAYSAFYGWLQKQEDLPDDMGVQEWYDNAVENFRDADQYERRGMDEDEEAAAEEGYIDAAENLLIQQLNAFFNGDSEEYKDFLKSRDIHKKGSEISGIDTSGLLEGGLSFDAGTDKFNFVEYCKSLSLNDTDIKSFADWIVNYSEIAEEVRDYGGEPEDESWVKVSIYYDANIENTAYLAAEKHDLSILLDRIKEIKIEVVKLYNQYRDFTDFHKGASEIAGIDTTGLIETTTEICEQATLNPNGELIFGKYRIFKAGSGTQTAPYAQAINDTNLFSKRLADDVKVLETLGFKFDTVYYYQPPPRAGKYIARAIAISGTDNNGEDIMWVRKGGFMAPSPAIYYKDSRAGDVKRMARLLSLQLKPTNVVTVEDFLKAAVGPTGVTPKSGGWGYKSKKIKLRPDGKYDILGEISLRKDYSYALVGKPFFINSLDDLPIKFGVIKGDLIVGLPVLNLDWFPEMVDGGVWFKEEAGMTPERFLEAGLLDRVTDDTEISFTTKEVNKYGLNKIIKFKSKADWIDTIKAQDIHQKSSDITGIDTSGLIEEGATVDKITETIKALMEVDSFEDFKRIAKQLPDLSNTIDGTPVSLLIQYAIWDNIGILVGDGSQSLWFPTTPQDFFYKALYYYLRFHSSDSKSSRAFNKSLSYRQGPSLEELENAFNKWRDFKTSQNIHQKSTDITGIDTSGLLESWTDKDIEDYWNHYYNVGDPGPIGAIKDWPGLLFFNKWFVDMIDRENWNVDSIEDYFIEYSDRVADNLEQKDNEDRGYGELQEIACYRGYKKLYNYYRQFLADTNSQIYKDWKSSEAIHQKTTDITGIDTSGLLEQGEPALKKPYITEFNSIITKAKDARTFNDFEAAFEGTDPNIWNIATGKFFHKVFDVYFNSEPLLKINSKNDYERTKFGHLNEAINHYGEYLLLSKTDAEKDRFSGEDARLEAAFVYKKQAENYFNYYLDIINAEEIHKKATDITGIDTSGLLEAYIWTGFSNEYLTDSFTKLIKKAEGANTFEEFLAAHDDIDPKIWSTAKAESSYFKTFQHIFNVDLYKDKDGTRGNFIGVDTKLGALYRAIQRMGFYTVAAKTDHNPWHHNVGTKEHRIKSDLESAKKYFDTYKDIVDSENIHQKSSDITGIDTSGLLESYDRSTIAEWVVIMVKAAELVAQDPKKITSDVKRANAVPADFWTPVIPSDGTIEGIGNSFINTIKQAQKFDLYNGNFTPVPGKFKVMKYDPNRPGSMPNGYQFYPGNLNSSKARTFIEYDLYDRAHRALLTAMYKVAKQEGSPLGSIPAEVLDGALRGFIRGDYKKTEAIYKDYLDAQNIHQKSSDITGIDTSGLLESNKAFDSKIYDIYKKALEANSFEEFKDLIKQLPDPWKYEVMVGGAANSRAIISDILGLKDFPSSYNPKTPADHFLTAVDHIQDVEHSTSVTLDDIRSGYAYAQEHFAKWLEYKKSQEIHQKTTDITGIDTSGLMEEAASVSHEKRFALMKWARAIPDSNEFAKQWASKSGFSEEDIENFGGEEYLIDGLIDWFVDMESDATKYAGGRIYDMGKLSLEQQIALYQKLEDDAVEAVKNDLEELYKDWVKSREIHSKGTDITGIDTSGLLESNDNLTSDQDKTLFFRTVEDYKKYLPVIPDTELIGFYNWFNNVKRVELGFGPYAGDNESSWDVFQQITMVAAEDVYGIPEHEIPDEFRSVAEMTMEKLYEEYKAHYIYKKSSEITGIDTSGLLEARDITSQEIHNRLLIRWKEGFIDEFKKVIKLPEEEGEKVYQWLLNKATETDSEEPRMYDTKAEEIYDRTAALYAEFVEEADTPGVKHANRHKAAMKLIYKVYLEELKAQQIHQTTTSITGIDTSGLLESEDDDSSRERYWDHALEATATDWINSFKSYVGLERANKIYTWMLNKARVEHDSQATYNNLIDMYGKFAGERRKKDGLNNWVEPDTAKVLADIADAYDAEIIAQKTTDITGIDAAGLLEAKQYTGPLGPVKDKQGKEHDYQGWYNIIKPFIIDLLKAAENNDFSSFVKLVDSRQKNMGGPGFNPYFNLVDKVYAKVLQELLDNEQAENAFDEAYSTVQSMIVYIDVHLKGQWDRDPNTLQRIPHAQIKQEYPRAIAAFNKFKDFLDAKNIHQKATDITGIDTSGLLEAKSKSTPEQDKYWGGIIYDYINKLVNADTFEEFMGLVEDKPATFQFNPGMYYHDKIFVNAIDSILGSHDKETGNPVRSSFVAAFSAIQGFVSYIDLFYNKEETTPLLEKHRAETKKKFDQWIEARQDWKRSQEIHQKAADITGIDTSGLLE